MKLAPAHTEVCKSYERESQMTTRALGYFVMAAAVLVSVFCAIEGIAVGQSDEQPPAGKTARYPTMLDMDFPRL